MSFLITADDAFPAMEELCLNADAEVQIALHIFSPRTKTRSAVSHQLGLLDWGDMIAHLLKRGVKISFLLNDFDPIGLPEMHASVWERLSMLDESIAVLAQEASSNLTLLVAHPGGQTGAFMRGALWPLLRRLRNKARADFNAKRRALPPGLHEHSAIWPPVRSFTQTLHQKFLVADGQHAIVGGLDIDERRFDDTDHKLEAHETWHDVSVEVRGSLAGELSAHFRESWRRVLQNGYSHAPQYLAQQPDSILNFELPGAADHPEVSEETLPDGSDVIRTLSARSANPFALGPQRDVNSIERAHLELIGQAELYIYIESQFFRSSRIRDAIAERLAARTQLVVIILLPGAPEEVAYQGDTSPVHRYGEWLQMRALKRLTKQFPDRFLCFALTGELEHSEVFDRDALFGKSMVYIHSKLIVVDDARAIISSANINGRSMAWDVEAGVMINSADEARSLRTGLWRAHLGSEGAMLEPAEDAKAAAKYWTQTAALRRRQGSNGSAVGPVPFPFTQTKRFAKRHVLIPENMV